MTVEERCAELKQKMADRRTKPYSSHVEYDGYDVVTVYSAPPRKVTERYVLVRETAEKFQLPLPKNLNAAS